MKTSLVYSKEFSLHNHIGHPENSERLKVMIKEIQKAPFFDNLKIIEPRILDQTILHRVHSQDMIQRVKDSSTKDTDWLDLDTYVCKSSFYVAALAAGGLIHLSRNVFEGKADNGFALIRPPGHHATRDKSMGFCLFNNVALAAEYIASRGKKVLIFDHDVHHGNGTQDIFYERNDVLYQSIHLSPHYPGTGSLQEIGKKSGEGYTINAPLSYGNGDEAVSTLLDHIFLPIAQQFKPDIIFFSVGYDSHHADVLGGLKLTVNFFGDMIAKFQQIQPKIVCTLEGGYNLSWIGRCLVSQLGQLTAVPITFKDDSDESADVTSVIGDLESVLSSYWNL